MTYRKIKYSLSDKIRKISIYLDQTINAALKNLSSSNYRMCIVLDRKNNFKGVLNDGDIRRALLNGKNLSSQIKNIYNKKPILFRENSVKSEILRKLDIERVNHAPIIKKNKVVGLFPEEKFIPKYLKIPVVIMCGGFGKRLKPMTLKIPKALVLVNKKPMLTRVINNLKKFGFKKFILSTYYKSRLIKNYYKTGKLHGIKISYLTERKPLGTAGSLSFLKNKIKHENFLVTNCDVLSEIDYKNLLNFHSENKADLTIAIKKYSTESEFGEINVKGIYVNDISEKPIKDIIINAAIYVIKTKLIKSLTYNKALNMNEFIIRMIKRKKKVIAFPFYENWFDLGTKKQIKIFNDNF